MVYPARDARVMRLVRKVLRGLCHHHALLPPVHDDQAWADIQRYNVPSEFLVEMAGAHAREGSGWHQCQAGFSGVPDEGYGSLRSPWAARIQ
jgi:hypothetical protein